MKYNIKISLILILVLSFSTVLSAYEITAPFSGDGVEVLIIEGSSQHAVKNVRKKNYDSELSNDMLFNGMFKGSSSSNTNSGMQGGFDAAFGGKSGSSSFSNQSVLSSFSLGWGSGANSYGLKDGGIGVLDVYTEGSILDPTNPAPQDLEILPVPGGMVVLLLFGALYVVLQIRRLQRLKRLH